MFKKIVAAFAALLAATAFAAVDANKATQAELEAISGIGPVISTLIISERKKGDFKDWNDLVVRVKGVGDRSAAKFSGGGLTVNGKAYAGAPEAPKASMAKGETAKATASKAASVVVEAPAKVASAAKGGAKVVAENAKEEKNALKDSVADAKAKRAEKKAEKKAEMKAEKAAAASAPKK